MLIRALFVVSFAVNAVGADRAPIAPNLENSAESRWLKKRVLESRVLDDMERLDHWTTVTSGSQGVVDARITAKAAQAFQGIAQMTLTPERFREGGHSIRFRTPTRLEGPGSPSGRGWGTSVLTRRFDGEDWSRSNRISFWVWADCPGFYTVSLDLRLHNDGAVKVPPLFGQEGEHTIVLRNREWNHVVWEIGNVARDRVTALDFAYLLGGNEPEASREVSFDFDRLELERVDPDYIEGWGVWPGRISYSHAGYQPGAAKIAIANGLGTAAFELLDANGQVVLRKPVRTVSTHLGTFQALDFSEMRRPGVYTLAAGAARTHPFRIAADVWRETILKALNFFYAERCGFAVPGVHGVCHRDWQCVHGDKRIVINGGWHDAGDLTQGLGNTAEAVYGMLSLAEKLHARNEDPELYARLVDEARWGLDWILKTSFGDGYRNAGSVNSRRTDGILGTDDDIVVTAKNQPLENFVAAAAEAIAARVLKQSDSRIAAYSLKMAREDWDFGVAGLAEAATGGELWRGSFDSAGVVHEPAAAGVLAAVEIWRGTGERRYAEKAVEMARVLLDSQERRKPKWNTPLIGFFYTGPDKQRLLHYCHRGREQAPILALAALAEAFPDHPDWMKWYSAVVLHTEYLKTTSKYTEPYGVLPASVYEDHEYEGVPETRRESFRAQVLNGIPLGAGHYLRLFPVWMDYRGHFGTILPKAQALSAAARLRGDAESAQLAQDQAEWVLGRNPFAQSTMYGEGYDYTTLYTPMSGDIAGALPVGIQTRGDSDVPYWPVQSTWTYKEVWVHPVSRWIWLMGELYGNAVVKGKASGPVEFRETASGQKFVIQPDAAAGTFRAMLPEGNYTVQAGTERETRAFLRSGLYDLDLRPGKALDVSVSRQQDTGGQVTIRVRAQGNGAHRFSLRTDNLVVAQQEQSLMLRPGIEGMVEWRGRIASSDTPWVAVVVPDGDVARRQEVRGDAE